LLDPGDLRLGKLAASCGKAMVSVGADGGFRTPNLQEGKQQRWWFAKLYKDEHMENGLPSGKSHGPFSSMIVDMMKFHDV